MQLMDYDKAILIWESNKYKDIANIQNQDSISPRYPSSDKCPMCSQIDALCNEYYGTTDLDRKKEIIGTLYLFEINAYKLSHLFESFGHIIQNPSTIDNINHFLYSNKYSDIELNEMKIIDPQINDIRIESARWCATCGARKPDILANQYQLLYIKDVNGIMTINDLEKVKIYEIMQP